MMESRQIPTNVISRLAYELGLSDGELAVRAGITRSRLNRIKNGRIRPSIRDALLISRALGDSLDRVFCFATAVPTPLEPGRDSFGREYGG
jgi:transcriptional regulator with XRE-family HTH domain